MRLPLKIVSRYNTKKISFSFVLTTCSGKIGHPSLQLVTRGRYLVPLQRLVTLRISGGSLEVAAGIDGSQYTPARGTRHNTNEFLRLAEEGGVFLNLKQCQAQSTAARQMQMQMQKGPNWGGGKIH